MIDRPRLLRRFALALLLLPLLWAGSAGAAEKGKFKIRFSNTPDVKDRKDVLLVRPNQTQDYYLFVQNLSDKDETVTVEMLAGGKPVEGTAVTVVAKAKDVTPVTLGKPPQPAEKPGAAPAPPAPPAPPAFAELPGDLAFMVYGTDPDDPKKRVALDDPVKPVLARPSQYVTVTGYYDPKGKPGIQNQLVLQVDAAPNFQGGKCRVEIALNPKRIPGLIDTPKKQGTRGGFLEQAGDELTLTANNLLFRDTGDKPDEKRNGTVYVTIDGYERAYIFNATFPRGGETRSDLQTPTLPVARLKAPESGDPAKPLPVAVEVDNAPPKSVVEISLDRDGNNKFNKKNGEVITLGKGDRHWQLFVNPAFPGGALQLKSLVSDWGTNLDVAEIYGPRLLRFRLLDSDAEIIKADDEDNPKKVVEFSNSATDAKGVEIVETVVFDGTAPENLKFVDFPAKLVRGTLLPVKATVADPESGIKEVVFYVGKPGPDGKMPANASKALGKLTDTKAGVWTASLDAPTEQKGKVDVTAQVTNGAGLVATETVVVQLVDALPGGAAGPAGKASIQGKVVQGDRPQPNVPVLLRDPAGGVKDTTLTDDKGGFLFKEVAPGTYRVYAGKTGDNTKGETIVQVLEGQKKTDVAVSLVR